MKKKPQKTPAERKARREALSSLGRIMADPRLGKPLSNTNGLKMLRHRGLAPTGRRYTPNGERECARRKRQLAGQDFRQAAE